MGNLTYGELVTMRESVAVAICYTLSWHSSGGTRDKIGGNKKGAQYFCAEISWQIVIWFSNYAVGG